MHFAARWRLGRSPPNIRPHRRWGLQSRSAPGAPHPQRSPPSSAAHSQPSLEVGGACPWLQRTSRPTRPSASLPNTPPGRGDTTIVQWLRSPHHPSPAQQRKNETAEAGAEGAEGMKKTSSEKALDTPNPTVSPPTPTSPAPKSRGADSSEAPPGVGRERERGDKSGEALPRGGGGGGQGDPRLGAPWRPGCPGSLLRGASSLTGSGGAVSSGRSPAQREQQPERQARDVPMVPGLDGAAAAAAAARSAQQVTSPSERRWPRWGRGREEGKGEEGKEFERGGKGSREEEGTPSSTIPARFRPPSLS